ncbi:CidA/LrgA family protein [Bdellovibrio sp. 22V]|uniref:CidA/LrgA family protein n=1 Tax=Bdellovibrio TaxID=958 RepID=UPI002542C25B|nr:CidA/LrgA family protein [Bdellovibrio sp. 22V]WII72441.1 CidA/LrgA family protein [Bdellovibrio sp. 22V]
MIQALLILLIFQFAGEGTVRGLGLIVPGPVVGMVYFFGALIVWPGLKDRVAGLADFITKHLSLFFVPAGVGIIEYFDLLGKYGVGMVFTIVVSTLVTLAVTALIFNRLLKKTP